MPGECGSREAAFAEVQVEALFRWSVDENCVGRQRYSVKELARLLNNFAGFARRLSVAEAQFLSTLQHG